MKSYGRFWNSMVHSALHTCHQNPTGGYIFWRIAVGSAVQFQRLVGALKLFCWLRVFLPLIGRSLLRCVTLLRGVDIIYVTLYKHCIG